MTLFINGVEHLTIKEAAELCGRHHDTIKRRVERRDFPNAFQGQDRNRSWLIPMPDLVEVGLFHQPPQNKPESIALEPKPRQTREQVPSLSTATNDEANKSGIPVIDLAQRLAQKDVELAAARACADERLATITLLSSLFVGGVR